MFKDRPILKTALGLTLFVDAILIILVFYAIGVERLPFQIGRILFQLLLIALIVSDKSNKALFILTGYHILSGLGNIYTDDWNFSFSMILGLYHITIGLIIYFHDFLERNVFPIKEKSNSNPKFP